MEAGKEETRVAGGTAPVTAGVAALVLVAYPLSGGPVAALFKWAGWSPEIVGLIYCSEGRIWDRIIEPSL